MSTHTTVALVGDSVLDNFYWLTDKKNDLTQQLTALNYNVANYAVDESRLGDIISGAVPRDQYKNARHYPYPVNNEGKVCPLDLITQKRPDLTVLSIGGNDLRANLLMVAMAGANAVFTPQYIKDFEHVITTIKLSSPKIILVCMYIPYLGQGSPYAMMAPMKDNMVIQIRRFYETMGKKFDIPVLDLSRTLNCYDRTHYGSTVIEPSNLSSQCIAECIQHIHKHYSGYKIYYAPNCDISKITSSS